MTVAEAREQLEEDIKEICDELRTWKGPTADPPEPEHTTENAVAKFALDLSVAINTYSETVVQNRATFVNESPSGIIDGVNPVFQLTNPVLANSMILFLTGTFQIQGTHYNVSGPTITFITPPPLLSSISATYQTALT